MPRERHNQPAPLFGEGTIKFGLGMCLFLPAVLFGSLPKIGWLLFLVGTLGLVAGAFLLGYVSPPVKKFHKLFSGFWVMAAFFLVAGLWYHMWAYTASVGLVAAGMAAGHEVRMENVDVFASESSSASLLSLVQVWFDRWRYPLVLMASIFFGWASGLWWSAAIPTGFLIFLDVWRWLRRKGQSVHRLSHRR